MRTTGVRINLDTLITTIGWVHVIAFVWAHW